MSNIYSLEFTSVYRAGIAKISIVVCNSLSKCIRIVANVDLLVHIWMGLQECRANLRKLQRTLKTLNLLELLNSRGFSWKRVTRFERATFTLAR